jgi:general secretion pathway protein G
MKKLQNEKGMSLIEIMIVLSIIGVIAYALFGDLFLQGDKAKAKITQSQIDKLVGQVKLYKTDTGNYPSSWDDVVSEGFMSEAPVDAWSNDIELEAPGSRGNKYEIWSYGPDEESDTEDDIVSWKKSSQ